MSQQPTADNQQPVTCSYQGEIGAYSEVAVETLFPAAEPVARPTFEAVFESVVSGEVDRGVVPIENSLFGSVHINYDLLREHDVRIVGEVSIRIQHCLLGLAGVRLSDIRQVHSHPQALGQCREWLRANLPQAETIPAYDTAGAARMLNAMQLRDAAAIASARAGAEYNLTLLAEGIESNPNNFTRFLALSRPADAVREPSGGAFKTTILYALKENVPGALFKTLAVFALRDIDLLKIESRPLVGSPGNYLFYVDVAGHIADDALRRAADHLEELSPKVTVLGSYPVGRMPA